VQAYVASRTPRAERTQALSLIASSFGLGTVIGPALAPLMVLPFLSLGLTGPFICFAAIGMAALVLLRWRLPDDEPQYAARGQAVAYSSGSGAPVDPARADEPEENGEPPRLSWRDPRLRPWVFAGFFGGHAQAMVLGISGFLVLDRLGLRDNPAEGAGPVGLVLMSGAIATLLAQWGLIPRFDLGPRAATLWGIATAALGTVVLAVAGNLHLIALGYAIATGGCARNFATRFQLCLLKFIKLIFPASKAALFVHVITQAKTRLF
jgi:hypothetical protein